MKLFTPQPNNDLFKITEIDSFTTKRMTKKHPLWSVLKTISNECINGESYSDITFSKDNFNKPNQTVYAYLSDDGAMYLTKSLKNFSGEYKTLKGWGIKKWKEM
jgi:hypothetical protein